MKLFEVKDVFFRYTADGADVVHSVSFSVDEGEFLAVVGSNGSGKSTLARLLNALLTPTKGTVTVNGLSTSDQDNAWEIRKTCGMVFQNPDNQLVATIVEEDVAFGLENLGVEPDEIRRRVRESLDSVGMTEYATTAPHMLSGGQKQRIAIAGVLAMCPKAIIFDESTAMLDPTGRSEVMNVIRRLNREHGITIIWITHFMDEAAVADRILVMNNGSVSLEGRPREVFRHEEILRECGLDVPEMTALAHVLIDRGLNISSDILTVDEMVVELCRLKSET